MAKGNPTKKKKPKVGDTVYIKGEIEFRSWLFYDKIIENGKELAHCTTTIPKLNAAAEFLERKVPVSWLTLVPPAAPSFIYVG